jgi:hypothetical protein
VPVTLAKIRDRVLGHIRDVDNRRSTFQPQEVDLAICDAFLALDARLPASSIRIASGVTVAGGGSYFTLPTNMTTLGVTGWGTAEYAGDIRLQRVSTGQYLARVSTEKMDAYWNFIPEGRYLAIPFNFALWRDHDELIQGRTWPGCAASEPLNAFVNVKADDLRDYVGSGSGNLDTVTVELSRIAVQSLVYDAAAELLTKMSDADTALRKISKAVIPTWMKKAATLAYQEEARRNSLEDEGRLERWAR